MILAIIALIATPIVLNIIEEAKANASLRSVDFYLDAVEQSVVQAKLNNKSITNGRYDILNTGNVCLEYDSDNKCIRELKIELKGEKPSAGEVIIKNGKIEYIDVTLGDNRLVTNSNKDIIKFPCTLISGDKDTLGSKYECEVKPGTKYNFYVLSKEEDGTTNLMMDRNICEDGLAATKDNGCFVEWIADSTYGCSGEASCALSDKGPITAMIYLYNATKDWINILPLNYEYYDKAWQESLGINAVGGYDSFISINGVGKINDVKFTEEEPLRARLPIYAKNEGKEYGELISYTITKGAAYQYDNLNVNCSDSNNSAVDCSSNGVASIEGIFEDGIAHISKIWGYWTLSSNSTTSKYIRTMWFGGYVDTAQASYKGSGVRSVINIKL